MKPLEVLKKNFGYNKFREGQIDIINSLIEGNNISVIIPTGGGKSLCYQIPSIIREGVGVIISPLIALMDDQVNALKQNGINAVYLNSTLNTHEKRKIIKEIESGKVDLMYISPELLFSDRFLFWIQKIKISLFAIDESHCLSQWGHNFRSDYAQLSKLKELFPEIPRIALTATANEMTREEIRTTIGIDKKNEYIKGFDRPNITYYIQEKIIEEEYDQLIEYIEDNHDKETGIVYCISKKRTEDIASFLRKNGKNAVHYHAGLQHKERKEILGRFTTEEDIIVVATIAFGMGIDKPNVRFVCHMDLPSSVEAYYQETGRAGRDGKPSIAWMLYGIEDVFKREAIIEMSHKGESMYKNIEINNLNTMFTLCEVNNCRRQVLIGYFGDKLEKKCGNCDNCLNPKPIEDATIYAQKALSTVMRTKQKFGLNHLIDVLLGNKTIKVKKHEHHELSVFGVGIELKRENWKVLFRQLIVLGYLKIEPKYNVLWLTSKSLDILKKNEKIYLNSSIVKNKIFFRKNNDLSSVFTFEEKKLLIHLKKLRMKIAKENKIPAYLVFNDETLNHIVYKKPRNLNQLENIEGIGFQKARSFGEQILNKVKEEI